MSKTRTDVLNHLAKQYSLNSYLEIGTLNKANNFNHIICKDKIAVDPSWEAAPEFCGTSDEFFLQNNKSFDLIFLDGLHYEAQIRKDFENALQVLNPNGRIVIHDACPEFEHYTHVPRDSRIWNGDVYKFTMRLREYANVDFVTVNIDHGCSVIWKDNIALPGIEYREKITWEYFQKNKKYLLHLISWEEFTDHSTVRIPCPVGKEA